MEHGVLTVFLLKNVRVLHSNNKSIYSLKLFLQLTARRNTYLHTI